MVLASSVLKVLLLLKAFVGKTFVIHAKIAKLFFCVAFVVCSISLLSYESETAEDEC